MHAQRRQLRSYARLAASVFAAALISSCGGSAVDAPAEGQRAGALAASKPGELLAYVKDKLRERAREPIRLAVPGIGLAGSDPSPGLVPRSGTTVQEVGIDEDDLIKTDGERIYTIAASARDDAGTPTPSLVAHRRLADGSIEVSASLALAADANSYQVAQGMLLAESARRIAVLGENITLWPGDSGCWVETASGCAGAPAPRLMPAFQPSRVLVQLVEAGADGSLVAGTRFSLAGRLIGSRLVGAALVVVTSHQPVLAAEALLPGATAVEREAALDTITAGDVLPTLRTDDGAAAPLVAETDCYVQPANASPGIEITTISVFDLSSHDAAPRSRCIVGGTEALYLSPASLVLATTRYNYRSEQTGDVVTTYPTGITTDLHKFALGADLPVYRGSGTVAGHLGWDSARKSYRISEHEGNLRVLSFTGVTGWGFGDDAGRVAPSPATLTVLRERASDRSLEVISQLPNPARPAPLGKPGEQVYGVRFLGDRAYVVTFRQIDPLYVIDLSDPLDPKEAGVLEVPGFSDWLFPIAKGLLFGVGRSADANGALGGVKVALFDVSDPAVPALVAERTFGLLGSSTALGASPHGLNWLQVGSTARLALPMSVLQDGGDWQRGLLRIEVDSAARTLAVKPLIPAVSAAGGFSMSSERSLQIGAKLYYLSAGQLSAWDW